MSAATPGALLVCASHSPLMLVDMPRSAPDSQDFLPAVEQVRARVERFAPDLVVVFGPDHFNGFFFDLMPVFCIGAAAKSTEDWQLPAVELNVPADVALACVDRLEELGVVLKDLDLGLLDFPSEREGEDVLLCWQVGEESVTSWHGLEEGYAGRKPIDWSE